MRRRVKSKKLSGIVVLLFMLLLAALSLGKRGFIQQFRIRLENRQLRRTSQALIEEKKRLEEKKAGLEDPAEAEKVAREDYNMARDNEKVLHVVQQEKK